MKGFFLITLLVVYATVCTAQENRVHSEHARPAVGWDSFKEMIIYPEIARRAGVEGISNIAVKLDTSGAVIDIMISGYDIFDSSIEQAIRKARWLPEIENGKPKPASLFFDVQFQYRNTKGPVRRTLIIEADKANAKPEK
ncbi:MAG: energy transducer TonB [Bacteroidota bacterium]